MNYKFYKYNLKNDADLFDNLEYKMKESNYVKIFEKKLRDGLEFSIYEKNSKLSFNRNSYCIYIYSDDMSEENLDYIINYEFNKYL